MYGFNRNRIMYGFNTYSLCKMDLCPWNSRITEFNPDNKVFKGFNLGLNWSIQGMFDVNQCTGISCILKIKDYKLNIIPGWDNWFSKSFFKG